MSTAQTLGWRASGEAVFADAVARAVPFGAPSALAGWTRAHVLAHVAGNAAALCNLLHWAATGQETPMYSGPEARQAEIDQWALADPADLVERVTATSQQLSEALETLPERAWDFEVRSALGRSIPTSDVPWLRAREVWVHAVDLVTDVTFTDLPEDFSLALIGDVVATLSTRAECPDLMLHTAGATWGLGASGTPGDPVNGRASDLLAWLIGRASGSPLSGPDPLPPLPRWL